jgi:hypothetical protein
MLYIYIYIYIYRLEKIYILRIYSTIDDVLASNVGEKSYIVKYPILHIPSHSILLKVLQVLSHLSN